MANTSASTLLLAQQSAIVNAKVQNFEAQYTQALANAQTQYQTDFIANQGAFCAEEITLIADYDNMTNLLAQYTTVSGQSSQYVATNQYAQIGGLYLSNAATSMTTAVANAASFAAFTGTAAQAIEAALKSIIQLSGDVAAVSAMITTEDNFSDMSSPASAAAAAAQLAGQQAEQASYDALNLTIAVAQSTMNGVLAGITDAQTNCATLANAVSSTNAALQADTANALNAYLQASATALTEQTTNNSLQIATDTTNYMLNNVNGFIVAYNNPNFSPPVPTSVPS